MRWGEKKFRNLSRTIGGVLFAALLIPLSYLLFFGTAKLIKRVYANLPHAAAVLFTGVIFLIALIVTAVSRIYTGGGSAHSIFKDFHKR